MTRMNNVFRVAAILALGLCCSNASAGIITVDFELEVVSPGFYLGDLITGTISWEEDDVADTGFDDLSFPDFFEIEVLALGQAFDETNDIDFPVFPTLEFFDGEIIFMDYIVSEIGDNPVGIDAAGVIGIDMGTDLFFDAGLGEYTGTAFVTEETFPNPHPSPYGHYLV